MTSPLPRIRRLRALLDERDCEYAVVAGADHTLHMSGYVRYMGAPAAVVIGPDDERTLIVARFELAPAEDEAEADQVVGYGGDDLLDFAPFRALVARCRDLAGGARVAIAGSPDFVRAFGAERETIDIESDLLALRRIKDDDELERVGNAFRLALVGQEAVEALAQEGRTEIELFTAGHAAAQEAAGTPVEFLAALASGSRTSLMAAPLHVPGPIPVPAEGPLLSDIAIRHRGYWGDSTRTFGEDDATIEARYVLSSILEETVAGFRPGRRVADVYSEMHTAITSRLPGASFPHHGGHGIGIGVGEDPQIIPSEESVVEAGMAFALEPGAYWPDSHGARVENTYVVRPSGTELV